MKSINRFSRKSSKCLNVGAAMCYKWLIQSKINSSMNFMALCLFLIKLQFYIAAILY